MKASIRKTEDGTYELGGEIDGVFVPFVSHASSWVEGIVIAGKSGEAAGAGNGTSETPPPA